MPVRRKRLVTAVLGVLVIAGAGGAWAMSDDPPQRACDDGPTVYMYGEGQTGPLSREDCGGDWTPYAPVR